ncbi:MAG: hypothetical protein PHR45_09280 [Muribaculaceae bacterium]|nr:hypothetical protein [Muribaculaceae bacterium]
MEAKKYPCAECKMRRKYEENPKSLMARFWHWHTSFCPGWKAYYNSLTDEDKSIVKEKYHLK